MSETGKQTAEAALSPSSTPTAIISSETPPSCSQTAPTPPQQSTTPVQHVHSSQSPNTIASQQNGNILQQGTTTLHNTATMQQLQQQLQSNGAQLQQSAQLQGGQLQHASAQLQPGTQLQNAQIQHLQTAHLQQGAQIQHASHLQQGTQIHQANQIQGTHLQAGAQMQQGQQLHQGAQLQQQHVASAGAVVRSSMPAQVQVIQPMAGNTGHFVHQPFLQQQLMLQNAAAVQGVQVQPQTLNATQLGQVAQVSRVTLGTSSSPSLMSPSPQTSQANVTISVVPTSTKSQQMTARATGVAQNSTQIYNQKQVLQPRQPVVIGQLGAGKKSTTACVLSNQTMPGQTLQVAQSKSPTVSIGAQGQVINSPTQIRFTTQQTFVTSNGQIIGGNLAGNGAMLNQFQAAPMTIQQQGIPINPQQSLIGCQNATILTAPPIYLRAAGPIHAQHGILGNVQAVAPTKGKLNAVSPLNTSSSSQPCSVAGDAARVRGLVTKPSIPLTSTITPFTAAGMVKTITTNVQGLKTISTLQGVKALNLGAQKVNTTTVTASQISSVPKGVANILPQGQRTVAGSGNGSIQQIQVAPHTVTVQPQTIKTIQPLPGANQASLNSQQQQQQQQQKQVSKVRAMKVQPKTPSPALNTGAPRIQAPNTGQPRLGVAPSNTRPPTLAVQPKPQVVGKQSGVAAGGTHTGGVGLVKIGSGSNTGVAAASDSLQSAASPAVVSVAPSSPDTAAAVSGEIKQEAIEEEDAPVDDGSSAAEPPVSMPQLSNSHIDRQTGIVKPNVLTHVIEGFVIREAPEPFPVQRSSMLNELMAIQSEHSDSDSNDRGDMKPSHKSSQYHSEPVQIRCEFCGRMEYITRYRRSKRFCSVACAKRYNVGCSRRMGLFQSHKRGAKLSPAQAAVMSRKKKGLGLSLKKAWQRGQGGRVSTGPIQRSNESPLLSHVEGSASTSSTGSSTPAGELAAVSAAQVESSSDTERSTSPSGQEDSSSAPRSPPELERIEEVDMDVGDGGEGMMPAPPTKHPAQWNVKDVSDFILSLPGCEMYSEEFLRQEIDGQALLLLKEDHLMTTMNIKLGPALKICARINTLREELG